MENKMETTIGTLSITPLNGPLIYSSMQSKDPVGYTRDGRSASGKCMGGRGLGLGRGFRLYVGYCPHSVTVG